MTDEQLRALYGQVMDARGGDRGACPSPEALDALVRREGAEADRLETLDHVMACPGCRRDFDLLRAVRGAAPPQPVSRPAPRARGSVPWRRFAPAALLAASLVVGAGIGLMRRHGADRAEIPAFRGGTYAIQLVEPAPNAIATAPLHFVWHAAPDVRRYTLEVLDGTGAVRFTARTADTTHTVPAGVLRPGVPYQWWIRTGDGSAGTPRSGLRALLVRQ